MLNIKVTDLIALGCIFTINLWRLVRGLLIISIRYELYVLREEFMNTGTEGVRWICGYEAFPGRPPNILIHTGNRPIHVLEDERD